MSPVTTLSTGLCLLALTTCAAAQPLDEDTRSALRALSRLASAEIPETHLACEINGTSTHPAGGTLNNPVTVGDFIASYLNWSFQPQSSSVRSFSCEGNGLRQCIWSFGEHKRTEGWNRFLHFTYDPQRETVEPDSLRCIDVP